jgi:hypothetical protein
MTYSEFADYVRYLTNTDEYTLTNSELLTLTNIWLRKLASRVEQANESYFAMEMKRDLIEDRRMYPFPDEVLNRIIRVELKLDGDEWEVADPLEFDMIDFPLEEDNIQEYMADYDNPKYTILRRSLYLLTADEIEDVTEGIKLFAKVFPSKLTTFDSDVDMSVDRGTVENGFPQQFHELLARRVSMAYKDAKSKPIPYSELEKKYEADFQVELDNLTNDDLSSHILATIPYDDGFDY